MSPPTVWVTGARGFVGRHLARSAARRGMKVYGLGHGAWLDDDYAAWGLSGWLNGEVGESNLDLLAHDSGMPGAILHCAGGSSVGASVQAPLEDFARSVASTARLLEWMRQRDPACRLVLISSAAVYGSGHLAAIGEHAATSPYSPYGHHKLAAELLARSYHQAFGLAVGVVRLFSLYGEELRKQLIWDICHKLKLRPQRLVLGGSGREMRDFIHVADAADFVMGVLEHLGQAPGAPMVVNCGSGLGRSIRSVAESLVAAWEQDAAVEFSGSSRPGDPESLVADVEYPRRLGLAPRIPFEDGIRAYVDWFQKTQG
jgi:UDP-glucose 4-epimerase